MPKHIKAPNYIAGISVDCLDFPEVKNESQVAGMKQSCKLAASILQQIENFIQVKICLQVLWRVILDIEF